MPSPHCAEFDHLQAVVGSGGWSTSLDAEQLGDYIRSLAPPPEGGWSDSPEWERWSEFALKIVSVEEIKTFLAPSDQARAARYASREGTYPPVVLRPDSWVIDGNGRVEAAKLRGDHYILAYQPV